MMKTTKRKVLVVVVLMLGTLINYANVDPILKNTHKVRVFFENVQKDHLLTVKDSEGVSLYKENIAKDGNLIKLFDFSSLKDGNYSIEVDKDVEILIQNFEVKNNDVLFNNADKKVIYKPVIRSKNDLVLISRINNDKLPLDITIYYNDAVIVEETIASEEIISNKAYKLKPTMIGNYRVVVALDGKHYIKDFSL